MRYDAFISYSQASDAPLAMALKLALQRFARPWYRRRALKVFLDDTDLGASPGLWTAIESALGGARQLVFLASPAAAASVWTRREIAHWRSKHPAARILIVLTEGEIAWDDATADFDPVRTTALPCVEFRGAYREVPLWIDLRWARSQPCSLTHPRFRDAIADLAAPLHGMDRSEVDGEDLRQHRKTLAVAWSAVLTLALLAAAAGWQWRRASQDAEQARQRLVRLNIANGVRHLEEGDASGALLWFGEVARLTAGRQGEDPVSRLRLAMVRQHHPRLAGLWSFERPIDALAVAGDGTRFVAFLNDGAARVSDLAMPRDGGSGEAVAGPGDRVLDVWLSDGRTQVLTVGPDGVARVRDPAGGVDRVIADQGAAVRDGDFSPDGRRVVTAGGDGVARVLDIASGQEIAAHAHGVPVGFAEFGSEANVVLTASDDRFVRIWDLRTDTAVAIQLRELPVEAAISQDASRVLTITRDLQAMLWDARTGEPVSTLGDWAQVYRGAISPDGRWVAMVTRFGWLRLWEVPADQAGQDVSLGGLAVSVAFDGQGTRLVTGATDNTARVWDVESGKRVGPILWHDDTVHQALFTPDGRRVLTAVDRIARLWELEPPSGTVTLAIEGNDQVRGVEFSADGTRVLARTHGGARVWRVDAGEKGVKGETGVPAPILFQTGSQMYHAAFSPDGEQVLTCTEDGVARLWDAATGDLLRALDHDRRVVDASFLDGGKAMVTASGHRLWLWDLTAGVRRALLEAADDDFPITNVECDRDGSRVFALHFGRTLRVWNLADQVEIAALRRTEVQLAAFAPVGTRLACADSEGVHIVDTTTGSAVALIPPGRYRLTHLAFSADGERLVTTDDGGTARIWHAGTGLAASPPLRHESAVGRAVFGAVQGAGVIATASEDGTVRLWDARTGEPVSPPLRHGTSRTDVALSPDGRRLMTASERSLRLWELAPVDGEASGLITAAELLASRRIDATGATAGLTADEVRARWEARPPVRP